MFNRIDLVFLLTALLVIFICMKRGLIQVVWYIAGTVAAVLFAEKFADVMKWNYYMVFSLIWVLFLLIGIYHRNRTGGILPEKVEAVISGVLGTTVALMFVITIVVPFIGRFYGQHAKSIPPSWTGTRVIPAVEKTIPYAKRFNVKNFKEMSLIEATERMGFGVVKEGLFIRKNTERRLKPLKDLKTGS